MLIFFSDRNMNTASVSSRTLNTARCRCCCCNSRVLALLSALWFCSPCQDLEEPGEDTSKYDIIMPTVVRPKCPDIVSVLSGFDSAEVRVDCFAFGFLFSSFMPWRWILCQKGITNESKLSLVTAITCALVLCV